MNQQQVWNNIAEEWFEFKDKPAEGIIKFLEKQKGKVLDMGSGSGRHLMQIKNGEMYLVDFSKEMIKLAKQKAKKQNIKAEFFVSKLTKLPFKDNFFDSAICISSLHCVKGEKNREKTIQELFRVIKPEKEIKIAVWNKDAKRFKNSQKDKYVKWRDKGARYYYLYKEKEIHDLFEKAGFKITKKFPADLMITFKAIKKIKPNQN